MSHDIQDLLNLIKDLEKRIIQLEIDGVVRRAADVTTDRWYWDH